MALEGKVTKAFYTYIALNYIYRGLKYIHKDSQHALIGECQLTVVQGESKTWINGTGGGNGNDVTTVGNFPGAW